MRMRVQCSFPMGMKFQVFFSPGTNFRPIFPMGRGSHRVSDMGVFFNFTLTFGSSFGRVRIILIKTGHNFLRCTVKLWSRPLQVNHLKKEPMLYYKILISRVPDPKFSFRNTMETWRAFWFGPSKASEFENSAVSIQFSLDV